MKETAETEKLFALEQGNVEHGLPYITVIVDGGWAKRSYGHGYTSNSGVAYLINIPHHVFGKHSNCRLDYCKRMDCNEQNFIPLLTSCNLFVEIVKLIENVMGKADRLVANETTNSAERYMSLVAKFTGGKRINFTQRGSYQRRCIAAGLAFNTGPTWHGDFLNTSLVINYCMIRQKQLERVRQQRRQRKRRCKHVDHTTDSNDYGIDAATIDISEEDLNIQKQKILDIIQEEANNRYTIWNNTVGQANNMLWHQIRRQRLTASNFHSVCPKSNNTLSQFIKKNSIYKSKLIES
ncbi:hypothetical protein RN001_009658 [Aquatica leii]|uniref:Mutator-like transposase domain-containing protein n=1 Tax=Aquatica leii TaxID=1421715 RepID=A0AAN7P5J0_9COLE|nr:hypothetical protein RN001_009658 [Aquatica leii]